MSLSLLRFDHPNLVPELFEIDDAEVAGFLASPSPLPGLYLLETPYLDHLLSCAGVLAPGRSIRDLGKQHVTEANGERKTMCLKQTFERGQRTDLSTALAVRAAYSTAGRTQQGIKAFLKESPADRVFLVGVTEPIFQKLARNGVPPCPSRVALRRLRGIYVGASARAEEVRANILLSAPTADPVLILGEKGTGKELVARELHRNSGRSGRLLVLNCSTIPPELAESILFGCVRGAFTGAVDREGLFEAARGGTLFLDEIGHLPPAVQPKLLRAIEYLEVFRLGSTVPTRVDVKVVAATNRDLLGMVARGEFLGDLYDRLLVSVIRTPSLRDHREDFYRHLDRIWREEGGGKPLPSNVVKLLAAYEWPGNVRQLRNYLKGLAKHCQGQAPTRDLAQRRLRELNSSVAASQEPATVPPPEPRTEEALLQATRLFAAARGVYLDLEQVLRSLVEQLVRDLDPFAVVRSRTKTVASLAERLQRRWAGELFRDVRDLCGLRVIVSTKRHKEDLLESLRWYVEVDLGTQATEQDPPGVCWIRVDERRAKDLGARLGIEVPREIARHWAELELRTLPEDALASYRDEFLRGRGHARLPELFAAELRAVEEALERAERAFERTRRWTGTCGAYLTPTAARAELRVLETTLRCAPTDATVAARAGRLAIGLGEFDRAIALLEPHVGSQYGPLLRDLGVALCQTHDVFSAEFRRGVDLLEQACRVSPRDPEAFSSLAGACRRAGDVARARDLYRKALVIDDAFPYAVGGYVEMGLTLHPDSSVIVAARPRIERAIGRCRDQVKASVGLPWAHLNLGKFLLLLGRVREGLDAYVEAIGSTTAPFMLETSLRSVESLTRASCVPRELEIARRMLAVGWHARFPSNASRDEIGALPFTGRQVKGPVLMVVGKGGDPSSSDLAALGELLADGVRGFAGTLTSVGDLDRAASAIAVARTATADPRAVNYYRLADVAFAAVPGQPSLFSEDVLYPTLVPWIDLLTSGVGPSGVLLLALGDEPRTTGDRRLALQLGARVAVLKIGAEGEPKDGAPAVAGGEIVVRDARALRALIAQLSG